MKFTKIEIKVIDILLTAIVGIVVTWLCVEGYFVAGIIACIIGILLVYANNWWRSRGIFCGATYPFKEGSEKKIIPLTAIIFVVLVGCFFGYLWLRDDEEINTVLSNAPTMQISAPLLSIELARVKSKPPFEHLAPELAYDMVLYNKGDVAIYGIIIYIKMLKDRNKQIFATTGQAVKDIKNFPKRIPGVLSPKESKAFHRIYSHFVGYMELTVTCRDNSGGWYRCDFKNDRNGFFLKGCKPIKKKLSIP